MDVLSNHAPERQITGIDANAQTLPLGRVCQCPFHASKNCVNVRKGKLPRQAIVC